MQMESDPDYPPDYHGLPFFTSVAFTWPALTVWLNSIGTWLQISWYLSWRVTRELNGKGHLMPEALPLS